MRFAVGYYLRKAGKGLSTLLQDIAPSDTGFLSRQSIPLVSYKEPYNVTERKPEAVQSTKP